MMLHFEIGRDYWEALVEQRSLLLCNKYDTDN